MSIGSKLTNPGSAIGRKLDQLRLRRRQQVFAGKVVEALAELGLDESELEGRVRALLEQVCSACYERDRGQANATALALEFFLRLALEYPALVERAMKSEGVFVASIGVIRSWHALGRIPADMTETSIVRIKDFLVAQLRSMDDTDDDRMRAEFQIREL
jgi:hypothetical protein